MSAEWGGFRRTYTKEHSAKFGGQALTEEELREVGLGLHTHKSSSVDPSSGFDERRLVSTCRRIMIKNFN